MNKTESLPTLSVIIPTYQRAADVQHLLASLEAHMQNVDIFVVDDCSPDPGVFDGVKDKYPAVHFVRGGPHQGHRRRAHLRRRARGVRSGHRRSRPDRRGRAGLGAVRQIGLPATRTTA